VIAVHHHNRPFLHAVEEERRTGASLRRTRRAAEELERIVVAAAAGDGDAWSTLLERFAPRVRRVARAHRLAAHDIDDVVQTTWLRLLRHIDALVSPGALGAWLEVTARRESLRLIRDRERLQPTAPEDLREPSTGPVAEQRLVESERLAALARAVGRLPDHQQRLFSVLLADPDCSYSDISRRLGIPVGSIGPTRARGIERLRNDTTFVGAIGEVA
jgi:RNA polymerase sigma factor (sigma-70 family)